jgi:hypothetical protein
MARDISVLLLVAICSHSFHFSQILIAHQLFLRPANVLRQPIGGPLLMSRAGLENPEGRWIDEIGLIESCLSFVNKIPVVTPFDIPQKNQCCAHEFRKILFDIRLIKSTR